MRGANPIRSLETGDGGLLYVKKIFSTIQGEGPRAGQPAVFIRLGGCNLACKFCDTDFERFEAWRLEKIIEQIQECHTPKWTGKNLIVITGGEPLRQAIEPLCEALMAQGFTVQIETNGTLFRPLPPEVEIVCSPKNTGQGYMPLRSDLLARLTALKFLISAHDAAYGDVAEVGQTDYAIPVYVQPMDEYDDAMNQENLALATRLAIERGYRLSLQLHKIIGVE